MLQIQHEQKGENQFLAGQSWNQHWRDRIRQLEKIDDKELIEFIVTERKKRGLPEIY